MVALTPGTALIDRAEAARTSSGPSEAVGAASSNALRERSSSERRKRCGVEASGGKRIDTRAVSRAEACAVSRFLRRPALASFSASARGLLSPAVRRGRQPPAGGARFVRRGLATALRRGRRADPHAGGLGPGSDRDWSADLAAGGTGRLPWSAGRTQPARCPPHGRRWGRRRWCRSARAATTLTVFTVCGEVIRRVRAVLIAAGWWFRDVGGQGTADHVAAGLGERASLRVEPAGEGDERIAPVPRNSAAAAVAVEYSCPRPEGAGRRPVVIECSATRCGRPSCWTSSDHPAVPSRPSAAPATSRRRR